MTYSRRPGENRAESETDKASGWARPVDKSVHRSRPLTRRYEISFLSASGQIEDRTHLAPALPQFEHAVSAVARGTLIATEKGQISVEDLRPGTLVLTDGCRVEPLLWIGSMTLYPARATPGIDSGGLVRITADRFGYARPISDLVLGPSARLLHRHRQMADIGDLQATLVPVRSFVDGLGVIRVDPMSPVPVYHLAFAGHRTIRASGIEVESYHPGSSADLALDPELLSLLLGFFPHIRRLDDFGPLAHPRVSPLDAEVFAAE